MKKIISAAMFVAASTASINADEVAYIAGDSSALTAVCLAALDSAAAAKQKANELALSKQQMADLACSGTPVSQFRSPKSTPATSTGYIALISADATPVTELCVAAITSNERFERLKRTEFSEVEDLEQTVQCNGLSLKSFIQKYNNKSLTAAL